MLWVRVHAVLVVLGTMFDKDPVLRLFRQNETAIQSCAVALGHKAIALALLYLHMFVFVCVDECVRYACVLGGHASVGISVSLCVHVNIIYSVCVL